MKSMRPKWEGLKDLNSAEVQFYDQLSIFNAKEWLAKIIKEHARWKSPPAEQQGAPTQGCLFS